MKRSTLIYILIIAGVLAVGLWWIMRPKISQAPTINNTNQNSAGGTNENVDTNTEAQTVDFSTLDLADRDPKFNFAAQVPEGWVVEYIPEHKAINFYNPSNAGTTLDDSVIYVTYYENDAVVLPTLDYQVDSTEYITVLDYPTTSMDVTLKSTAKLAANQPTWMASRHLLVDVNWTTTKPIMFYRFAKSPTLSNTVFTNFLQSLTADTSSEVNAAE